MHIKFATLCDKHALGTWICSMEPWHCLKSICIDEGLKGLDESYEDGHELDGVDKELG